MLENTTETFIPSESTTTGAEAGDFSLINLKQINVQNNQLVEVGSTRCEVDGPRNLMKFFP